MNWFDWLFPSQANAAEAGMQAGPPMPGGEYGPPQPTSLGQVLEPYGPPASAGPVGPPMGAMAPQSSTTPDGSTTPDQSAPEMASQQAGQGWQDRLASVLKNVKAPAPPDVVKPSTPPPPRPHAINNDFTRILLARAQAGGGQPSVPLALGRVLGGR